MGNHVSNFKTHGSQNVQWLFHTFYFFFPKLSHPITWLIAAEWDILLRLLRPRFEVWGLCLITSVGTQCPISTHQSWKLQHSFPHPIPPPHPSHPPPVLAPEQWPHCHTSLGYWRKPPNCSFQFSLSHPCPPSTGPTQPKGQSREVTPVCQHLTLCSACSNERMQWLIIWPYTKWHGSMLKSLENSIKKIKLHLQTEGSDKYVPEKDQSFLGNLGGHGVINSMDGA